MWRRARHLPLVVALAAVGWVAAPAFSVEPYLPAAEDFSQALPRVEGVPGAAVKRRTLRGGDEGHAHPGEGPVSHRSEAIGAPKRFNLAGLAGELRPYEIRARASGGKWSGWVEATDGNPVYFGEADELQLRTRGWRPTGRLHYVNVSGTSTGTTRLLNGVRGAINSAVVSVASIVDPAADASPPRPQFVNRRAWGADRTGGAGCQPRSSPAYGEVRAAVIHHTVTASEYTEEQAPSIVLGICRFHRNGNGWNDIGYNALTDRFGNLYVGRAGGIGRAVVGAHAAGFNAQTTGVAAIGTHTSQPVTPAASRAFARYIAWKTARHGIPVRGTTWLRSAGGGRYAAGAQVQVKRLIGHRRVSATACPGDALSTQMNQIRRRAVAIRQASEDPAPNGEQAGSTGEQGVLRLVVTRVRPETNLVSPGDPVRYRARARNRGDAAADPVRICLPRPGERLLRVRGERCREVGALAPGATAREVFRVRATARASGRRLDLRFVARSPGARNDQAETRLRVSSASGAQAAR
jgi:hypothetical protein